MFTEMNEVLEAIRILWKEKPLLRLGQLMYVISSSQENTSVFYMSDQVIIDKAKDLTNDSLSKEDIY